MRTMLKVLHAAPVVLSCMVSPIVQAYELITHSVIANRAYEISSLGESPNLLSRLDLFDSKEPFGRRFYDFWDADIRKRFPNDYEVSNMGGPTRQKHSLRIRGWMMRGAIREDDSDLVPAIRWGEPYLTDPDPLGLIERSCNHFFDPVYRRALSILPSAYPGTWYYCDNASNQRAPDWALGTADAFTPNPEPVSSHRNHFTVASAHEAMWRALTLRTGAGVPAPRATGDNDAEVREAYWATTFRALGDVVHLIQDMAQPQHTRNEPHGLGHAALFERYVDARADQKNEFSFDGEGILLLANGQLPELPLKVDYPIPRFGRYSDYWSTATGGALASAKGLADYSSRGFFTSRKNVNAGTNDLALPVPYSSAYTPFYTDPSQYESCLVRAQKGPGNLGIRIYLQGAVPDSLTNSSNTVRMASFSAIKDRYALDRCVFDDRINLLIPRAVAYSAGVIDYFFRGRLEVRPPDEGVYSLVDHYNFSGEGQPPTDPANGFKGFGTFKLKLSNVTPDILSAADGDAHPQDMSGGKLVAVVKYRRHLAYTDDLAGEPGNPSIYRGWSTGIEEIVVSSRVKTGSGNVLVPPISVGRSAETYVFEFDREVPINATDIMLQVVYRGALGSEADAVVVETIDISEPTYFAYMNASDYIHIDTGVYTRDELNAGTPEAAILRSMVRPQNCIVNDRLRDDCFLPFPLNFPLKWGASAIPSASLDLPTARTYSRFAMLVPSDGPAIIDQSENYCLPNDAIVVTGRREQTRFVADSGNAAGYSVQTSLDPLPPPVRGVHRWHTVACVANGNGSIPGTERDNRYEKMLEMAGSELKPVRTVGFQFGAL